MILITGGAGFIGSTLANYYATNDKVVVVDDLSMGELSNLDINSNIEFIEGSVSDNLFMEKVLRNYQFEYIFHLGAIASVADSIERPLETHKVNFESVFNLLENIRTYQINLKRLVFASSAAVYGDEPTLPKQEESIIRPLTPYAVDKFSAERYVLNYYHLYDVPTTAVRFFNVFGPRQNPKSPYSGVISIIVDSYKKILAGSEMTFSMFGDGTQSRDFIFIEDVIQALDLVAKNHACLGQVFNVGTGKSIALNELIETTNKIVNATLPVNYLPSRAGDIYDSLADVSKIEEIGFSPKFTVEQGLKKYFEYEFK